MISRFVSSSGTGIVMKDVVLAPYVSVNKILPRIWLDTTIA